MKKLLALIDGPVLIAACVLLAISVMSPAYCLVQSKRISQVRGELSACHSICPNGVQSFVQGECLSGDRAATVRCICLPPKDPK